MVGSIKLPSKPYVEEGATAKMHDHPLSTEEIINEIVDVYRKAEFTKLADWLRNHDDDDMAHFINEIALKKNFARDYRVQTHLLKMMIKLFKTAEMFGKPYQDGTAIWEYTDRWKALQKEVTSIRTFINRLLHTTYRGTKRKPHGGTRDESRGSPDSDQD